MIFLKDKTIDFGEENLLELIFKTADSIKAEDSNEIALENKICLAIAIRLETEKYLINKLPDFDLKAIKKNQTQALFKEYCKKYPDSHNSFKIDKVNLMTPENIHINAFMFEPLIDMSMIHLMNLYEEIKSLN